MGTKQKNKESLVKIILRDVELLPKIFVDSGLSLESLELKWLNVTLKWTPDRFLELIRNSKRKALKYDAPQNALGETVCPSNFCEDDEQVLVFSGSNNGLNHEELEKAFSIWAAAQSPPPRCSVSLMMPERQSFVSVWVEGTHLWDFTALGSSLPHFEFCHEFQYSSDPLPLPEDAYKDFAFWLQRGGLDQGHEIKLSPEIRSHLLSQWPRDHPCLGKKAEENNIIPSFLENSKVSLFTGIDLMTVIDEEEEFHLQLYLESGGLILSVGVSQWPTFLEPLKNLITLIHDPDHKRNPEAFLTKFETNHGGYFFTDPEEHIDHLTCPEFVDALSLVIKSFHQAGFLFTFSLCSHLYIEPRLSK